MNGMRPVHPGEILRDELEVLGMSANALSRALAVPFHGADFRAGRRGLRRRDTPVGV